MARLAIRSFASGVALLVLFGSALFHVASCDASSIECPDFFADIPYVRFEGNQTSNLFAFRYYDADEVVCVRGTCRKQREWLRFSVAFWHTIRGEGRDPFGEPTKQWPWETAPASDKMERAKLRMNAMFQFLDKLGVDWWCFHDRDIAPEGEGGDLKETERNLLDMVGLAKELQQASGKKLLWATANLFSSPRYMNGAGTSPDKAVFLSAALQVKQALDAGKELGGEGYVFWGGREGYATLLNTDMGVELDHLAALFRAASGYADKIGWRGQFLIEPKPREPSANQYDYDVSAAASFLRQHNLQRFKINVECNHATLSGHSCAHELELARTQDLLGSIDINRGDPQSGWDTDEFLMDLPEATRLMLVLLEQGGFERGGGLNFDAKLRRESTNVEDLFYAHIASMDAMARGLKAAAAILNDGALKDLKTRRYRSFEGYSLEGRSLADLAAEAMAMEVAPSHTESASQEKAELLFSTYI